MSIDPQVKLPDDLQLVSTSQTTFRLRPPPSVRLKGDIPSSPPTIKDALFTTAWSETRAKINAVVSDLQRDLLDDLVTFVHSTSHLLPSRISKPIPTALLVGSSRILNEAIGARLKKDTNGVSESIPIILSSRACLSFSSTIKTIVTSLESIVYANSLPKKAIRSQSLLARDDVDCIRSLYTSLSQTTRSKPRMVLIIEEFEAFNPPILQDLILVLSGLIEKMSIVMIFSLTTTADALYSVLPRSLLVRLQITPFAVHLGDRGINLLIQNLIFDPRSTFDLSPFVIRNLITSHEQLNNSIDNVISKLQVIHLAHFHSNPLVKLFNASRSATVIEDYESLIDGDVAFIARQLSLTTSWQSQLKKDLTFDNPPPTTQSTILENLVTSYEKRPKRIVNSSRAFDLLKALGTHWPEKERTTEWLLFQLHQPQLLNYSAELCKLLRHSNDDSVSRLIPTLIAHLENHDPSPLHTQLENLTEVLKSAPRGEGRAHLVNTHEPHLGGTLVKADKDFSQLLVEISESLAQLFNFGSKSGLVLSEAWTFDDILLLKNIFHPSYSETLKQDLEDSSNTDLGRAYALFKDAGGRRINLADWMGAFISAGSVNSTSKGKKKGKGKEKAEGCQKQEASFLCAVGGLGIMGFIGVDRRKAEHVAKTFW